MTNDIFYGALPKLVTIAVGLVNIAKEARIKSFTIFYSGNLLKRKDLVEVQRVLALTKVVEDTNLFKE